MATFSRLHYDPSKPTAFSTLKKLGVVVRNKKQLDEIRACIEKQHSDTLQLPIRERFARNHYTVYNVMDV